MNIFIYACMHISIPSTKTEVPCAGILYIYYIYIYIFCIKALLRLDQDYWFQDPECGTVSSLKHSEHKQLHVLKHRELQQLQQLQQLNALAVCAHTLLALLLQKCEYWRSWAAAGLIIDVLRTRAEKLGPLKAAALEKDGDVCSICLDVLQARSKLHALLHALLHAWKGWRRLLHLFRRLAGKE